MKADFLALRNAEKHVHSYTEEFDALTARHAEAMDCKNCEAFLQMGVDAFEWLIRADRVIRMAVYRGELDADPNVDAALQELCKAWLVPCQFAEKWVVLQQERGYEVDNLSDFRRCVEEMTAIVEASEEGEGSLTDHIAHLRDQAVQEHRDGETAEFI